MKRITELLNGNPALKLNIDFREVIPRLYAFETALESGELVYKSEIEGKKDSGKSK